MITLHHVSKEFEGFQAVKAVSLKIDKGEIHGIIGASGAGKSTLLRLINLLEVPEAGQVEVNGQDLTKLRGNKLREARKAIGMIFQHFNLVANKTVYENVAVSLQLSGFPWKKTPSTSNGMPSICRDGRFCGEIPCTVERGTKATCGHCKGLGE